MSRLATIQNHAHDLRRAVSVAVTLAEGLLLDLEGQEEVDDTIWALFRADGLAREFLNAIAKAPVEIADHVLDEE